MSTLPTAYTRAAAGRHALLSRFETCRERLKRNGRSKALRSFQAILARGTAAINMPIPKLVRFIEGGEYLSIYEFVAKETGLTGEDLERAVSDRLREFGPVRLKLDRLFGFQHDSHYASLNLGGAGARRYGCCCVVFDLRHWAPFHTCYAGDSVRACCHEDKTPALTDEEILAEFAIGEDLERLATVRWEPSLQDLAQGPYFDNSEVRHIVEAADSLLEIHLHGPVTRDRIEEVRLAKADYRHLRDLVRRAEGRSGPFPWEFDNVEPFRKMLEALDRFEIALVLAED
jgi:hypothetical protein